MHLQAVVFCDRTQPGEVPGLDRLPGFVEVLGLLLDNLIPGTDEERGLTSDFAEVSTTGDVED